MTPNDQHSDLAQEKSRVAAWSLLASFVLASAKFAAAIFSGSLGLLSEAFHSLLDFAATGVTLFAIRYAERPADDDHPFGHAKMESVAALIETGMHDGRTGSFDPATATFAVTGALAGIGRWFRSEGLPGVGLRDAIDLSVRMLMRGVLGEQGGPHERDFAMPTVAPSAQGDPAIRLERHFGSRVLRCYATRPKNLASLLAQAVASVPQREALVCDDLRLSWLALHSAVTRCAGGLLARGIRRGHYHREEHLDVESSGIFWHMCDLIWLLVYPVIYLL